MIFIGFPGIGKSTLASKDKEVIDLESSCFWWTDEYGQRTRDSNWFLYYCNVAEHLSCQGYDVFVNSHDAVCTELKKRDIGAVIVPSRDLKYEWIKRLEDRYNITHSEKDKRALDTISDCYDLYIEMILDKFASNKIIVITSMDYDLKDMIEIYKVDVFKQ